MDRRSFLKRIVAGAAAVGIMPQLEKLVSFLPASTRTSFHEVAVQFYSKRSLSVLRANIALDKFLENRPMPKAEGKTINFTKYEVR